MQEDETQNLLIGEIMIKREHKLVEKCFTEFVRLTRQSIERFNILKCLWNEQIQYIQRLKQISFGINSFLKDKHLISEQESHLLFGNYSTFIQLAYLLLDELKKILNNSNDQTPVIKKWNRDQSFMTKEFQEFVNNFQLYNEYREKLVIVREGVANINQNPIAQSIFMKSNFQDLTECLLYPLERTTDYNIFFERYEKTLPKHHPDRERIRQITSIYQRIVLEANKYSLNLYRTTSQSSSVISQAFRQFAQQQLINEFKVRVKDKKCLAILVQKYVLFAKKQQLKKRYQRMLHVQLSPSSFAIERPDGYFYTNQILLCGKSNCLSIFFEKYNDKKTFLSYVQQSIDSLPFEQEKLLQGKYVSEKYTFSIICTLIATDFRTEREKYYVVKFQSPSFQNRSQILYISLEKLFFLQNYLEKVHSTKKFNEWVTEQILTIGNPLRKEQKRVHSINQFLNFVFSSKEITNKPEYVFRTLNIFEGVWKIFTSNKKDCGCKDCIKKGLGIDIDTYRKIVATNEEKTCAIFLSEAQIILEKQLSYHSQNIYNHIKLANNFQNRFWSYLNQRIHPLDPIIKVDIKIYDLYGLQQINVPHRYRDDTVQNIKQEIMRKIGLDSVQDFGLYIEKDMELCLLDQHEHISSLIKEEEELIFKKKYILPLDVEVRLCRNSAQRSLMIIGELIRGVVEERFHFGLNSKQLKQYCCYVYLYSSISHENYFFNENKLKNFLPLSLFSQISEKMLEQTNQIFKQVQHLDRIDIVKKMITMFAVVDQWKWTSFKLLQLQRYTQTETSIWIDVSYEGIKIKDEIIPYGSMKVSVNGCELLIETPTDIFTFSSFKMYPLWKLISFYQKYNLQK